MKLGKNLIAAAVLIGANVGAHADSYGCQVLLCLSNPDGPMAVQQCEPPIQRFLREQAQRPAKPFPKCEEANGQAVGQLGTNPYDACPEGTTAVAAGTEVIQGAPAMSGVVVTFQGIGEGDDPQQGTPTGKKVCAGKFLGDVTLITTEGTGDNFSSTFRTVKSFDRVVTLDPATGSPRYVDVLINGKQYRRVRF